MSSRTADAAGNAGCPHRRRQMMVPTPEGNLTDLA